MSINLEEQLKELEALSEQISDLIYENKFFEIVSLDKRRQKIITDITNSNTKAFVSRLKLISNNNARDTKILENKVQKLKQNNKKTLGIMAAYSKN
ncbi:hypothetical protein OA253_02965 [Alphaproteobacteria bacterium]|nr:hypothetical protein [Alphaproteobacteria bacterium]